MSPRQRLRPAPPTEPHNRTKALLVAAEVAPMSPTARGLAVAGLAAALPRYDIAVTVVAPTTEAPPARWGLARRLRPLPVELDGDRHELTVYDGTLAAGRAELFLVDCGGRLDLLCAAALELARAFHRWPDAVHATDESVAALLTRAAAVTDRPRPLAIASVHRDGWQPELAATDADVVVAPSPEWARQLAAATGARAPRVHSVLPGIDPQRFDPRHDAALPAHFGPGDLAGKAACKRALQQAVGLPSRPCVPLIAVRCSRTDGAIDPLLADDAAIGALDAQLLLLVDGDQDASVAKANALAGRYPTRVAVRVDIDDRLAHRVYAGADFVLDAARFDGDMPRQLVCWRYGAIPIVSADSGLADAVVDYDDHSGTGSGFVLSERTPAAALGVLRRAIRAYASPAMGALAARAMSFDLSWKTAAASYAALYRTRSAVSAR